MHTGKEHIYIYIGVRDGSHLFLYSVLVFWPPCIVWDVVDNGNGPRLGLRTFKSHRSQTMLSVFHAVILSFFFLYYSISTLISIATYYYNFFSTFLMNFNTIESVIFYFISIRRYLIHFSTSTVLIDHLATCGISELRCSLS